MLPNGKQRLFFSCFTVSSTSCRTASACFSTLSVRLLKLYSCFPTLSIGFIKSLQITVFSGVYTQSCRTVRRASDLKSAQHKKSSSAATWIFCMEPICFGIIKGEQPLFATATTAASGRSREKLLGQRPAGCECCSRHEASAGCRNPNSCPKRKLPTRGPIPP